MIITVTGIKGGAGKSTISSYLSICLHKKSRVLLADLDFLKFSSYLINKVFYKSIEKRENLNYLPLDLSKNSFPALIEQYKGMYDYIIIDCPTLLQSRCDKIIKNNLVIYVSDKSSLDMLIQFTKEVNSKKILVVNLVPPFPEEIEDTINKIKDLDFNLKVVVPFINKIFMSHFRPIENLRIEVLDKICDAVEKNLLDGRVIFP